MQLAYGMLLRMDSLRTAHAHAVQLTIDAALAISTDQLTWPTPCADWNLTELLDHMTVQNHGFAAAAGNGSDEAVWTTGAYRHDPVSDYVMSAAAVTAAFAVSDVIDRPFSLPELSREQTFPGSQAITMHLVDSLVHAWDVARAVGHNIDPGQELLDQTLHIAEQVPDSEDRRQSSAHFGPRVALPANASDLDRVLTLFGRSPQWPSM